MIKVLEGFGIGRPSTYAPTISLLIDREYIKIEKKQIHVRDIAFKVMDVLENHFIEIVDSKFSANLEDKLDDIAPVSYTHLTLPTIILPCRSRWSPYH